MNKKQRNKNRRSAAWLRQQCESKLERAAWLKKQNPKL